MFGRKFFFAFVALCVFFGIVSASPVNGVVTQNGVSIGYVSSNSGSCPPGYRLTTLSDLETWCNVSCTGNQTPGTWGGICDLTTWSSPNPVPTLPLASPCQCDTSALAIAGHSHNAMNGGNGIATCTGNQLANFKSIYIVSGAYNIAAMGINDYPKEYGTTGSNGSKLGEAMCTFAPSAAPTEAPTAAPTDPVVATGSKVSVPAGTVLLITMGSILFVATILVIYFCLNKSKHEGVPTVDSDTHKPVATSLELTDAKSVVPHSTHSV